MDQDLQKISFVILDESELVVNQIKELFQKNQTFYKSASFTDPICALEFLQNISCDVLFISSHLSLLTGTQFMRLVGNNVSQFVLMSHKPEDALSAYDSGAIDFLIKPIQTNRFNVSLNKISTWHKLYYKSKVYDTTFDTKTITINQGHCTYNINTSQILFIQALKDYTKIITPTKTYLTLHNLKHFLDVLDPGEFIRVHRSFAVSMKNISSIEHDVISVNKHLIPVGKTYKKPIHDLFRKSIVL